MIIHCILSTTFMTHVSQQMLSYHMDITCYTDKLKLFMYVDDMALVAHLDDSFYIFS